MLYTVRLFGIQWDPTLANSQSLPRAVEIDVRSDDAICAFAQTVELITSQYGAAIADLEAVLVSPQPESDKAAN